MDTQPDTLSTDSDYPNKLKQTNEDTTNFYRGREIAVQADLPLSIRMAQEQLYRDRIAISCDRVLYPRRVASCPALVPLKRYSMPRRLTQTSTILPVTKEPEEALPIKESLMSDNLTYETAPDTCANSDASFYTATPGYVASRVAFAAASTLPVIQDDSSSYYSALEEPLSISKPKYRDVSLKMKPQQRFVLTETPPKTLQIKKDFLQTTKCETERTNAKEKGDLQKSVLRQSFLREIIPDLSNFIPAVTPLFQTKHEAHKQTNIDFRKRLGPVELSVKSSSDTSVPLAIRQTTSQKRKCPSPSLSDSYDVQSFYSAYKTVSSGRDASLQITSKDDPKSSDLLSAGNSAVRSGSKGAETSTFSSKVRSDFHTGTKDVSSNKTTTVDPTKKAESDSKKTSSSRAIREASSKQTSLASPFSITKEVGSKQARSGTAGSGGTQPNMVKTGLASPSTVIANQYKASSVGPSTMISASKEVSRSSFQSPTSAVISINQSKSSLIGPNTVKSSKRDSSSKRQTDAISKIREQTSSAISINAASTSQSKTTATGPIRLTISSREVRSHEAGSASPKNATSSDYDASSKRRSSGSPNILNPNKEIKSKKTGSERKSGKVLRRTSSNTYSNSQNNMFTSPSKEVSIKKTVIASSGSKNKIDSKVGPIRLSTSNQSHAFSGRSGRNSNPNDHHSTESTTQTDSEFRSRTLSESRSEGEGHRNKSNATLSNHHGANTENNSKENVAVKYPESLSKRNNLGGSSESNKRSAIASTSNKGYGVKERDIGKFMRSRLSSESDDVTPPISLGISLGKSFEKEQISSEANSSSSTITGIMRSSFKSSPRGRNCGDKRPAVRFFLGNKVVPTNDKGFVSTPKPYLRKDCKVSTSLYATDFASAQVTESKHCQQSQIDRRTYFNGSIKQTKSAHEVSVLTNHGKTSVIDAVSSYPSDMKMPSNKNSFTADSTSLVRVALKKENPSKPKPLDVKPSETMRLEHERTSITSKQTCIAGSPMQLLSEPDYDVPALASNKLPRILPGALERTDRDGNGKVSEFTFHTSAGSCKPIIDLKFTPTPVQQKKANHKEAPDYPPKEITSINFGEPLPGFEPSEGLGDPLKNVLPNKDDKSM